jgi:hypothetical protein
MPTPVTTTRRTLMRYCASRSVSAEDQNYVSVVRSQPIQPA